MSMNILAVCSGNICRSPMAAALLRVGAGAVGLDVRVASAGRFRPDIPADPHAVAAMADRGLDITGHRSHTLTDTDISAAHLILGMATEHVVDIAGRMPAAFSYTFMLREFVDRAVAVGPMPREMALSDYLISMSVDRSHAGLLRGAGAADIADPLGQGRRAFDRTASELEQLCWATVDLLAGYTPRS